MYRSNSEEKAPLNEDEKYFLTYTKSFYKF